MKTIYKLYREGTAAACREAHHGEVTARFSCCTGAQILCSRRLWTRRRLCQVTDVYSLFSIFPASPIHQSSATSVRDLFVLICRVCGIGAGTTVHVYRGVSHFFHRFGVACALSLFAPLFPCLLQAFRRKDSCLSWRHFMLAPVSDCLLLSRGSRRSLLSFCFLLFFSPVHG